MNYLAMGAAAASVSLAASAGLAESRFTWDGEVELGVDSVVNSDVAADELSDFYGTLELNAEFALNDNFSVFGGITGESMTDPTGDRVLGDLGFYFHELGLRYAIGESAVSFGKITPSFGSTWDSAAGFYGDALAGDYELTEMIGATADLAVAGGTLSFGVFHADDTYLSQSAGFNRGRNSPSDGGAGNTGKFDNFAVQWSQELGDTFYHVGARRLSASAGDVKDETGYVAGIGHQVNDQLGLFAEVAHFDGFGGTADDATFVTLNAAYTVGQITYSGLISQRDVDSAGKTNLFSVGLDYELANGMVLGAALAHVDDAGTNSQQIGLNLVIPLGG